SGMDRWHGEPVRYPDPAVQVLDPSFAKYRLNLAAVERLATGFRWSEGPVWFGDGRFLLWSDIPNNRVMKWEEETGAVSIFRKPSNNTNGNTRDRQGRLVSCEHDARRVTRTEHDGTITVLADRYDGKLLNSPNDVVCKSDASVWFSDPTFGILGNYEGHVATPELGTNVYRVAVRTCQLSVATSEINRPNGLCFSPDESKLYVVVSGAMPREIRVFDVVDGGAKRAEHPPLHQCRRRRPGWHALRRRRQPLVRVGRRRGAGRRGDLRSGGQGHRPHPAPGALRQPLLRRRQAQTALHGR